MNVEFRRTAERRYAVTAHRPGRPPVGFVAAGGESARAAARRRNKAARRARAADMADGIRVTLDGMADDERRSYSAERIAAVCARMDELSARWSRLQVGESFAIEWTVRRNPRTTEHRSGMVE